MSFPGFLDALFDHGRVRVAALEPLAAEELRAADSALARHEQDVRQGFPDVAPPFDRRSGLWGATQFYRAAQFAVFRDLDAAILAETLSLACPVPISPAVVYSVDLTLRFLPDLAKLAKSASQRDPLMEHLDRWACEWPLSSVGMGNVEPRNLDAIMNHPGLLTLYVDRILARGDQTRLDEPRVCAAACRVVGAHPELARKLAAKLAATTGNSNTREASECLP